jgi:hypothetical protein
MHENAARALQYYEELPLRSGRPELRLVDAEPRSRRHLETDVTTDAAPPAPADHAAHATRTRAGSPDVRARRPADDTRRRAAARGRDRSAARPTGQTIALTRPRPAAPRLAGRPDRVAMWAVILGFFLTAVAAATGQG